VDTFPIIIVSYAIGLALANIAVYLMEQGQPALMYLVPLTLCTLVVQSRMNGELKEMWQGPRRLQKSDKIVNILLDGPINSNLDKINRVLDMSIAAQEAQENTPSRRDVA
jgi:Signal peptide peptidase.